MIPNRGIAVPMLARRRRVSSAARPTRGGRLDHQARYQASSCRNWEEKGAYVLNGRDLTLARRVANSYGDQVR